ncbi:hypothetical protein ACQ4PT_044214 [Festuca glaucescens]
MALRAAELRRLLVLRGDTVLPLSLASRCRPASTSARGDEGASSNAYDVLGVGETSSSAEIKASFHRLAKETHPDVAAAAGSFRSLRPTRVNEARSNQPEVQNCVLLTAAFPVLQILSDSQRRAHYDSFLRSQRVVIQKHPRPSQSVYPYGSGVAVPRESNVVEWLKWYRLTIDDIVTKKRIATGSSYFDRLESELYSAVHAAYYGPEVESMDFLPDCFEAEERSVYDTSELLHLVSGRDLFGIVSLADSVQELSDACRQKLPHTGFGTYVVTPNVTANTEKDPIPSPVNIHKKVNEDSESPPSDAYKDVELRICGRVVATANRRLKCNCIDKSDVEDHIHVFLVQNGVVASDMTQEHLLLGTITGLDTTGEEGSCYVYDGRGIETHVIVKHRTLMVLVQYGIFYLRFTLDMHSH